MKSISTINSAITENTEISIAIVCTQVIDFKSGCVALSQCVTTLCFASSSSNTLADIPSKE